MVPSHQAFQLHWMHCLLNCQLPKVEVEATTSVIGKNTTHSMQAGMFWGYVGLVNELALRCKARLRAMESDVPIQCVPLEDWPT